ncbi:MAG: tryptophan synthase subunit alpha [Pseudomonadota bacterium]
MNRLQSAFSKPHPAFVAFITAGDGDTAANLDALVEGGADVIELGMPFTDPMADGPAIQAANLRSLAKGTTTEVVFQIAGDFAQRHPDVPLILMGYANPMIRRGVGWFAQRCYRAGVDGVICVDMPPEENAELAEELDMHDVSWIPLATPTTHAARLPAVLKNASGFLYYVSVAGITGLQQAAQSSIEEAVSTLKAATDLPVAVGFGVREPDQAAAIARVADGVVVGSALVDLVGEFGSEAPERLKALTQAMVSAIEQAREEA